MSSWNSRTIAALLATILGSCISSSEPGPDGGAELEPCDACRHDATAADRGTDASAVDGGDRSAEASADRPAPVDGPTGIDSASEAASSTDGPGESEVSVADAPSTPDAQDEGTLGVDAPQDQSTPLDATTDVSVVPDGAADVSTGPSDASSGEPDTAFAADATQGGTPGAYCSTLTCGPGLKNCAGQCVSTDAPSFGCGGACAACDLPHAFASCAASACSVATCQPGWADCNHNPADGCEADLKSAATCV